MPVTLEQTAELADRIMSKRQFDLNDVFSVRISKEEKRKYLREITDDKGFYKLQKTTAPRWKTGKKGKRHKPMKKATSKEMGRLLDALDKFKITPIVTKRGIPKGYEITFPFETSRSINYKDSSYKASNVDSGKLEITDKKGKMAKLDRDIFACISEWAASNKLEITVSSDYVSF